MNLSINTRQAYSEVSEFLNYVGDEKKKAIPMKLRKIFEEEKDKQYHKKIDINVPIENQKLKEETLAIIALLNLQYWCKDENEKKRLLSIYSKNEKMYQQMLHEKYNTENLFKKKENKVEVSEVEEKSDVQLIQYKEPFYKKILNKIKNLFTKSK